MPKMFSIRLDDLTFESIEGVAHVAGLSKTAIVRIGIGRVLNAAPTKAEIAAVEPLTLAERVRRAAEEKRKIDRAAKRKAKP